MPCLTFKIYIKPPAVVQLCNFNKTGKPDSLIMVNVAVFDGSAGIVFNVAQELLSGVGDKVSVGDGSGVKVFVGVNVGVCVFVGEGGREVCVGEGGGEVCVGERGRGADVSVGLRGTDVAVGSIIALLQPTIKINRKANRIGTRNEIVFSVFIMISHPQSQILTGLFQLSTLQPLSLHQRFQKYECSLLAYKRQVNVFINGKYTIRNILACIETTGCNHF